MSSQSSKIVIATRGSALALTQTQLVLDVLQKEFPDKSFEVRIIKTTGDKLQTASLATAPSVTTKGLFTKELETALLDKSADIAVHSLKDLPTELPSGLELGAVCPREDVRDILIYRDASIFGSSGAPETQSQTGRKTGFLPFISPVDLPQGARVATSSTRRQAQLKALRPDLQFLTIRGNVPTRLQKLLDQEEIDALILAAAGLHRLGFSVRTDGHLSQRAPRTFSFHTPKPVQAMDAQSLNGLLASYIAPDLMLPCAGQAAIGIEIRSEDPEISAICKVLNHRETWDCVLTERAFLQAMGGGCQSPVGVWAVISDGQIALRCISFHTGTAKTVTKLGVRAEPVKIGQEAATELRVAV